MPDPADVRVVRVDPAHPDHPALIATLTAPDLAAQWWDDAESRAEDGDGVGYLVAYVAGDPAAWAGWTIDTTENGQVLRCCHNYVRREYRGHTPELYRVAYQARHRQIVTRLGLPGVTYLFPEPVGLHLASGWVRDTTPGGAGTSRPHPDGPVHHWQRLRWTPPHPRRQP